MCLAISCGASAERDLKSRYMGAVFSGDLSWMLTVEPESESDADLVRQFRQRFVERQDVPAFESIEDPLLRQIAGYFQAYWTDSLLYPQSHDAYEMTLRQSVAVAVTEAGYELTPESRAKGLIEAIRSRGWGFQAGRTPPLQDFILWRTTESKNYDVELTDRTQPVTVHFLDDFVSEGWANFATFGHTGTGGWANDEGLFCIRSAYDLASENFLVSYLKHEARHYADFELFPSLEDADLEYRAKLTELIFIDEGQGELIEKFIMHANGRSDAPHPLANWHVLNDLADAVDLDGAPDDPGSWRAIDAEAVRIAAGNLLQGHDRKLADAGSETTTGILTILQ
jgi:hypothetical protein